MHQRYTCVCAPHAACRPQGMSSGGSKLASPSFLGSLICCPGNRVLRTFLTHLPCPLTLQEHYSWLHLLRGICSEDSPPPPMISLFVPEGIVFKFYFI